MLETRTSYNKSLALAGFLTSPTPFQVLALDHPNLLVSRYPLVLIPAFMVPLSSIMHGICLWKLHRIRASDDLRRRKVAR